MKRALFCILLLALFGCTNLKNKTKVEQTVGSGDITEPAKGPKPAFAYGENCDGFVLVKNWDFGTKGTIRTMDDLDEHFQYHDQFGTFANGTNYGAKTVATCPQTALENQPVERQNTDKPIRKINSESMQTFLLPLDDAECVHPTTTKAGCGSFQAKWTLPNGGSLLGMDLLWETRVRYKTPPYFWFAIWISGDTWAHGAEIDVTESFGFDNGNGFTNYDGDYWHSSVIGGSMETDYSSDWLAAMARYGIRNYYASEYHTWTLIYRADDSYTCFMDGKIVQHGTIHWTRGGKMGEQPINMSFIFDGGWGHSKVNSVNHELDASELDGTFYEWDYSRIYLRKAAANKE